MTHAATNSRSDQYPHIMVNDARESQDSDYSTPSARPREAEHAITYASQQSGLSQQTSRHDAATEYAGQSASAGDDATAVGDNMSANYTAHMNQQRYHPQNNPQERAYDQSGFPLTSQPQGLAQTGPSSPRLQPTHPSTRSLAESAATSPSRIKVRDLSHIQSFASEEYLARPRLHQRTGSNVSDSGRQYEISSMPVTDIIEMVAGLLTKITTTNDRQHDHVTRPISIPEKEGSMSPQTSSVLAFHGKNVPSITILSYLSRIHKYCPTTYEVFLSLLVYFDRMTEMVNRSFLMQAQQRAASEVATTGENTPSTRPSTAEDQPQDIPTATSSGPLPPAEQWNAPQIPPSSPTHTGPNDLSNLFVVDSFNIHRLVIAGVTCASKFFSDVFYTNSRYAKVSLPPVTAWPR
jgi:PHO85 cyclin-6/7